MNFERQTVHSLLLILTAVLGAACTEAVDSLVDGGTGSSGASSSNGDWDTLYATSTFDMCKDCHAPGAPGRTTGTEATENWSTSDTAYNSLKGKASGLVGNFAGCNGVPLVGATSNTSLVVAVLDSSVRANFMVPGFPACNASAIADETLRVGPVPAATLSDFKLFIDDGGFR